MIPASGPFSRLSALSQISDFYLMPTTVKALDALLADPSPYHRAQGIRILGQTQDNKALERLVAYINDPADEVRLEAAAIENLYLSGQWARRLSCLLKKMAPLLHDRLNGCARPHCKSLTWLRTK